MEATQERNPSGKSIAQVAANLSVKKKEYNALSAKKRVTKAGKLLAADILAGQEELHSLTRPIKAIKPNAAKK